MRSGVWGLALPQSPPLKGSAARGLRGLRLRAGESPRRAPAPARAGPALPSPTPPAGRAPSASAAPRG